MSHHPVIGFGSIRGQDAACSALRAALTHDRLPHALLFAGPDGVGKRCVALALVAWLQCEDRGAEACGTCTSCRQIAAGSHPDFQMVVTAQGKKEIGVDRIRELKRFAQLQPVRGRLKAAIIDEAHMLTVAAQNALLKTLEEPPDRSLLILVAHNPDALLATVRSRCQRMPFSPLPTDIVVDILTRQHGLDAAAARELATLANGSPGRALALRSALAGEDPAHLRQQLAALGTGRYVAIMQLAHALSHPETAVGVKLEMLLAQYRDDAVCSVGAPHLASPAHIPSSDAPRTALRRADAVHDAWEALRHGTPNRQLLFEALLLRLVRI
jgi:DNA polymerase-3 subunit delta'